MDSSQMRKLVLILLSFAATLHAAQISPGNPAPPFPRIYPAGD